MSEKYRRRFSVIRFVKNWFYEDINKVGLVMFVFGTLLVYLFFPLRLFITVSSSENDPSVLGEIILKEYTGGSINELPVYKYEYVYSVPDGKQYTGTGYSTGELFDEKDEVVVYYHPRYHEVSMVPDLRRTELGNFIFSILAFPVLGALFMFFGTRRVL